VVIQKKTTMKTFQIHSWQLKKALKLAKAELKPSLNT